MSSSLRFTKAEFWLNGVKYLHQDGVAYTIRDVAKKAPKGVIWSVDMWKSRKAPAAVQKAFRAAWLAAPVCQSCGTKNTSGSLCDYCRCASVCDKLRAARTTMGSQTSAPLGSTSPSTTPNTTSSTNIPKIPNIDPRIHTLDTGDIIVGYKLKTQKVLEMMEVHISKECEDPENVGDFVYDYIMDDEFQGDMHTVYFPGAAKDLTMFTMDVPGDDHDFYVGYKQSSCLQAVQKKALRDFQAMYGVYIDT